MTKTQSSLNPLDDYDQKILDAVSIDGRLSVTDLSKQVGLSKTPCHMRLKRLEEEGYILGYRAIVDPVKLGLDHIAFVEVKLADTSASALERFNEAARKLPAIEQCHMIAGGFDYLMKVRTRNITEYRKLLGEAISRLPHIAQTSSYISMEAVKETAILET
ncbi:MAG: Lrp/AsnC ligand binding domain-containing protein [Hyphomicrobiales bacterium]